MTTKLILLIIAIILTLGFIAFFVVKGIKTKWATLLTIWGVIISSFILTTFIGLLLNHLQELNILIVK